MFSKKFQSTRTRMLGPGHKCSHDFRNCVLNPRCIVFTDRTAWDAAVAGSSITNDPFNNPIMNAQTIPFDSGVSSQASNFIVLPFPINAVTGGQYRGLVDGDMSTGAESITWTFPSQIFAFGLDFARDPDNLGFNGRVQLTGNFDGTGPTTFNLENTIGAQSGFFGVVGMSTFNEIQWSAVSAQNVAFAVDDLSFASEASTPGAPIPEPSTILLLSSGIAGLAWWRHRKPTAK